MHTNYDESEDDSVDESVDSTSSKSFMGDKIRQHLEIMRDLLCKCIVCFGERSVTGFNCISTHLCKEVNHQEVSRRTHALHVPLSLICILPTLLLLFLAGA